jgi:DNA helicase HerA-like ATPase
LTIKQLRHNNSNEVIGKLQGEHKPKLADETLVDEQNKLVYFESKLDFITPSTAKVDKASNGAFNGEFNRFLSRLETKLSDKRLSFLLYPKNKEGKEFQTDDFETILKQFLGYIDKSNITIIDLSGIPFEILSITISLVSRLVFDCCFHLSKLKHKEGLLNDVPFMIVCEEAHNYVPRDNNADYKPSRKSIERIAKEGRKYGLSLMVVSQRPSEVSETIFAQCNNFIALRLTNINDQSYIRSLMPENSNAIADILPNLAVGQCLVVGEAVPIPSIAQLDLPNPLPKSETINFHDNWIETWKEITFTDIIKRWKKE